eukprot:CAMPEP_0182862280 /NCGR_PEP_ID=MMETSP0034_2-20130328/5977_1 /TAXON_ID=156128 /ORGANISM="Nephroselmis pyriformis, Strain CCMP717" /LENGTH=196 /DNA_ID=CAMNT_0024994321 /DNA_START=288 /DNA_END=878 /DNA_ORIENTATION=+
MTKPPMLVFGRDTGIMPRTSSDAVREPAFLPRALSREFGESPAQMQSPHGSAVAADGWGRVSSSRSSRDVLDLLVSPARAALISASSRDLLRLESPVAGWRTSSPSMAFHPAQADSIDADRPERRFGSDLELELELEPELDLELDLPTCMDDTLEDTTPTTPTNTPTLSDSSFQGQRAREAEAHFKSWAESHRMHP